MERVDEHRPAAIGDAMAPARGLAARDGFVQQSRGRFEVDSPPDKGAVIRMLFPTADPICPAEG